MYEIVPAERIVRASLTTSGVLVRLFSSLEQEGFRYCVIGDSTGLPGCLKTGSDIIVNGQVLPIHSDVDIVIDREALAHIAPFVARFCRFLGIQLVQVLQHEQTAFQFVLAWLNETGEASFLQPDFCSDYYRNGRCYLQAEQLLEGRIRKVDQYGTDLGFYVPDPAIEFTYYLIKRVDKLSLNSRQGDHLSDQWRKAPEKARHRAARIWSTGAVDLIAVAAAHNRWDGVRTALPDLRHLLHRHARRSPGSIGKDLVRKTRRMLHPTGIMVVFLGADGSGKSSVIARILPKLASGFPRTSYMHLRPRLFSRSSGYGPPVSDPQGQRPRSWAGSVAKLIYYWFDYLAGYFVRLLPKLFRATILVFDRYYHDLLVDALRYRYAGPRNLLTWGLHLVPSPDLFILLDAPADVLQSRKQEVSLEETVRQREAYLHLVKHLPNGYVVDSTQPIDRVVDQSVRIILDHMAGRTRRNLHLEA